MTDILASWPNTGKHNEAWKLARQICGRDAGVSDVARKAQDILLTEAMPWEDEMERVRRG